MKLGSKGGIVVFLIDALFGSFWAACGNKTYLSVETQRLNLVFF